MRLLPPGQLRFRLRTLVICPIWKTRASSTSTATGAWRWVGGTAVLGYAERTTIQTGFNASITDISTLSVAVTVPSGHRIKVSGQGTIQQNSAAAIVEGYIREGSTTLARWMRESVGINERHSASGFVYLTPTAGAHTYKLSLSTAGGSADVEAVVGNPAFILVENLGP